MESWQDEFNHQLNVALGCIAAAKLAYENGKHEEVIKQLTNAKKRINDAADLVKEVK